MGTGQAEDRRGVEMLATGSTMFSSAETIPGPHSLRIAPRTHCPSRPGEHASMRASDYPLFGHNVLLGRYFNVDSNKCSNRKQDNPKCL
jgi:hypothetical protein